MEGRVPADARRDVLEPRRFSIIYSQQAACIARPGRLGLLRRVPNQPPCHTSRPLLCILPLPLQVEDEEQV